MIGRTDSVMSDNRAGFDIRCIAACVSSRTVVSLRPLVEDRKTVSMVEINGVKSSSAG
jgi:hypothetical protein